MIKIVLKYATMSKVLKYATMSKNIFYCVILDDYIFSCARGMFMLWRIVNSFFLLDSFNMYLQVHMIINYHQFSQKIVLW